MGKRRANNEGSITKRKNGKWMASLKIGIGADGRPKYKYMYADTQKEALQRLEDLKISLNMGINIENGEITVLKWCNIWMERYKNKLRPTTKTGYNNAIRLHISPRLGGIKINKLKSGEVQKLIDDTYKNGENSISLVIKVYNVLNGAMKQAVKNKMIKNNPCEDVVFPADNTKKRYVFTVEEQKRFIDALEGEQYRILFICYLYTGARLGELPALTWKDINFDDRYIDINKKAILIHNYYSDKKTELQVQDYCKTKSSIRKIYITSMLIENLKQHKEKQIKECEEAGEIWTDDNLVFPTSVGTILQLRNIQVMFNRIKNKASIKEGTMHSLRHTYATRCFEKDIDIKIISQQLGHKNVKTTYDTYVHVISNKKLKELDKLEEIDNLLA